MSIELRTKYMVCKLYGLKRHTMENRCLSSGQCPHIWTTDTENSRRIRKTINHSIAPQNTPLFRSTWDNQLQYNITTLQALLRPQGYLILPYIPSCFPRNVTISQLVWCFLEEGSHITVLCASHPK